MPRTAISAQSRYPAPAREPLPRLPRRASRRPGRDPSPRRTFAAVEASAFPRNCPRSNRSSQLTDPLRFQPEPPPPVLQMGFHRLNRKTRTSRGFLIGVALDFHFQATSLVGGKGMSFLSTLPQPSSANRASVSGAPRRTLRVGVHRQLLLPDGVSATGRCKHSSQSA